jgi:hypothetical protein
MDNIDKVQIAEAKYSNRIVAFLDLLGFKNFIKQSESKPELVHPACKLFLSMHETFSNNRIQASMGDSYRLSQFSDCFVVSCEPRPCEIARLLSKILALHFEVISLPGDVLLRGAVVRGEIYHHNNYKKQLPDSGTFKEDTTGSLPIVFGPALVKAYETEHNTAKAPRVLIHPDVNQLIPENVRFISNRQDADEEWYVDYLSQSEGEAKLMTDTHFGSWNNYQAKLKEKVERNLGHPDPGVREKYEWIANKLGLISYKECQK